MESVARNKGIQKHVSLPNWFGPFLYAILGVTGSYLLGAFDTPNPEDAKLAKEFNAGFALPIFTGLLWFINATMLQRAYFCLDNFMQNNLDKVYSVDVVNMLRIRFKINLKISVGLGVASGITYMLFEGVLATDLRMVAIYLNLMAIPFWVLTFLFMLQLFYVTRYVIKHFLSVEKIDLFGIKKLTPISDLVISNTVLSAISLAFVPLFWIGREIPQLDKLIVATVFILFALFLFWPVVRVQRIIARKKRLAISRINQSFHLLFDRKIGENRRLTDDPERLRKLSALISAKQEISEVSEWPIDLPQSIKGILICFSIPFSWIAGSLVETLVSKFL